MPRFPETYFSAHTHSYRIQKYGKFSTKFIVIYIRLETPIHLTNGSLIGMHIFYLKPKVNRRLLLGESYMCALLDLDVRDQDVKG